MSFMLLGILNAQAAGVAIAYWLASLGGSGDDKGREVSFDSDGNVYSFGQAESVGSGSTEFLLVKYDPAGAIQWQRLLGGLGAEVGSAMAIDSSDNVYVFGYTTSTGAGSRDFLLAKYNSSGTIQWQRVLGGAQLEDSNGVAIDSSDNVYVSGYTDSTGAGSYDFLLAKYNSSGTLQWQKVLGGASNDRGFAVAIDSSDNAYVAGAADSGGTGPRDFLLAKYNSSGTLQWQRALGKSGEYLLAYGVSVDSSNNVYLTGLGEGSVLLAKYNSSGTLQWQQTLGGASSDRSYSVTNDSSDNVYVSGFTDSDGEGSSDFLIAKYNSSGTIQWQRTLGATGSDIGESVKVDSAGTLYVLGSTQSLGQGQNDPLLAKLPSDGSLTGTYVLDSVNVVYAASTLTAGTGTFVSTTTTLTASTSSLTNSTSSLTSQSVSLTSHFVEIPA